MSRATLVYPAGRGIGEPIRMLFALAGWSWEEDNLRTREDRLRRMDATLTRIIPIVHVHHDDGSETVLEHAPAIYAYLARQAGLLPETEPDRYRVEMVAAFVKPFTWALVTDFYQPDWAAATARLKTHTGPEYLPGLERIRRTWGSAGHMVGSAWTLADVLVLDALTNYDDRHPGHLAEAEPALDALMRSLSAHRPIAAYLNGERRHGIPDAAYKAHVQAIF